MDTDSALLAWLRQATRSDIDELSDLADGHALNALLLRLDLQPYQFRAYGNEPSRESYAKLKAVFDCLVAFLSNELSWILNEFEPDVEAAAKGNATALSQLASLALACSVQSRSAQQHVEIIQSLDEDSQNALKSAIEAIMAHLSLKPGAPNSPSPSALPVLLGTQQSRAMDSLREDHDALLLEHDNLSKELAEVRETAETIARTRSNEDERARSKILAAEAEIAALAIKLAAESQTTADLNKRVSELADKAARADKLQDELDENRAARTQLVKQEAALATLRAHLSKANELAAKAKANEGAAQTLREEQDRNDASRATGQRTREALDSMTIQLRIETARNETLANEVSALRGELEAMTVRKTQAETEAQQATARLLSLDTQPPSPSHPTWQGNNALGAELALASHSLRPARSFSGSSDVAVDFSLKNDQLDQLRRECLQQRQARLAAEKVLEIISSGTSTHGDGAEANEALRYRLTSKVAEADRSDEATDSELRARIGTLTDQLNDLLLDKLEVSESSSRLKDRLLDLQSNDDAVTLKMKTVQLEEQLKQAKIEKRQMIETWHRMALRHVQSVSAEPTASWLSQQRQLL